MPTYHYPALIWEDPNGAGTAALIGDPDWASARGATVAEALQQLKDLVEWRAVRRPWQMEPDFSEPVLFETKVEVRPEYLQDSRRIPCPETIVLRVPGVRGIQGSGARVCVLQHLGISFNFQDESALKSLVIHYVREALQSHSPAAIGARLPPRGCQLGEVIVRVAGNRERRVPVAERQELKVLFSIAEPLLHDSRHQKRASSAYGREDLKARLEPWLNDGKTSILLVGESGCGKTTVLRDAVRSVVRNQKKVSSEVEEDDSDKDLRTYRHWCSTAGRIIAGMRYLGEWEERCEQFIEQLSDIGGVFCAENLLEMMQLGGEGPEDSVAAFLLPYVRQGELRMIAEVTPAELAVCRRFLPGFLDIFRVFEVPAFAQTEAIGVLEKILSIHAAASKLEVETGTAVLVYRLFKRFRPYSAFPGEAANFIHSLCDTRRLSRTAGGAAITGNRVVEQFARRTGLPEVFLRDEVILAIGDVREWFARRIIGQSAAVETTARLVAKTKAGLNDPERPLGVFLYCGPTGVGKTEMAKALAEYCFGSGGEKDRLIRLDMSEYNGWDATVRMLENPAGGPSAWIDRVRRQPFCVVLFDEIEKAASEVFDLLLGLLDEGRLTDRLGRVTDFRSAVLLLTSNLGAGGSTPIGFSQTSGTSYETAVSRFFRPEFFNRLDGVVTFKPLEFGDITAIARKELVALAGREGLAGSGIRLEFSDRLVNHVAREGYDPHLGARPLQRAVERLVVSPLARWKVQNTQLEGATLRLDSDQDGTVTLAVVGA